MKLVNKAVEFVDWFLYIILWMISIYFIVESDVIPKYLNKSTDTYETEIEAKEISIPDFTFCDWSERILGLSNEYDIIYYLKDLGKGTIRKVDILVNQTLHQGQCFVITPPIGLNLSDSIDHFIALRFNASIRLEELPQIKGYVNTQNNPQLFGNTHDGDGMSKSINAQTRADFRLKEERTEYLPGNCRTQPILKYLVDEFIKTEINCSIKCWPKNKRLGGDFEESLKQFPYCEDEDTSLCVVQWARLVVRNAKTFCNKVSYIGDVNVDEIGKEDMWCFQVKFHI